MAKSKLAAMTERMCPACFHTYTDDDDLKSAREFWTELLRLERLKERAVWEDATKRMKAEYRASGHPHRVTAITELVRAVKSARAGRNDGQHHPA